MVQLKSFKYTERTCGDDSGEGAGSSPALVEDDHHNVTDQTMVATSSISAAAVAQQQQQQQQCKPNQQQQIQSSETSSSPSLSNSISTSVGGNLTLASDQQSTTTTTTSTDSELNESIESQMEVDNNNKNEEKEERTTLSSDEEYQSAVHEIEEEQDDGDEDEDEDDEGQLTVKIKSPNLEQGKLEDIAKQRAQQQQQQNDVENNQDAVTRINIERGSITNLANQCATEVQHQQQHKFTIGQQQLPLNQTPTTPQLETPRTSRLTKATTLMKRSQTSPTALSSSPSPSSISQQQQQQTTFNLGYPAQSPLIISRSKLNQSNDNMSQYSFNTQKNFNTQFEIRWQNIRLFARQNSRLTKFITNSKVYKYFSKEAEEENSNDHEENNNNNSAILKNKRNVSYYSPQLQRSRKIPPTISEEFSLTSSANKGGVSGGGGGARLPLFNSISSISLNNQNNNNNNISKQTSVNGKCILNNISGQVFSGQMTAILGPSGVGKTTLLNSLTGRNILDGSGRVSLIGARERKRMSVVTVPQVDVLPGKLTTLEDLLFTSKLKNPGKSREYHMHNIERLVKHLHMEKFLNTRIDKLSGGEERRLSIARELLASPDIMILDEPTSGLDANTCKKIITALKDIVEHSDNILDKPMSIIVTIHQPQQEVYNLFHRIYLMALGGHCIYEGAPEMLMPLLIEQSSLAKVIPIDQLNENPAIVAIEVASGEYGEEIIDELALYHEEQVYEEFSILGNNFLDNNEAVAAAAATTTPIQTPRVLRAPRMSPLSVSRFEMLAQNNHYHRKRLNSLGNDSVNGRPTPLIAKRQLAASAALSAAAAAAAAASATAAGGASNVAALNMDKMSAITSISYASTYDNELPEVTSKLKVDKRLRRSVVMKSHLFSHTWTLMQRCWLLTTRDMFLMAIRILGYLLVAAGTVQIFSNSLDPNEHQCPQYESEVDNVLDYIEGIKVRLSNLAPMLNQANAVHLFFFHILLCITMVTSALTGLVFPLQMRMFMREYKNGWYSPGSFILSQTLAELPVDIIGPLLTLLITYPLCQQPASIYHWREIGYALVIVVSSIICKSQAQIVGAFLMDSVENSVFISCVCVTGPALLSGVPVRISQMVTPLQYISYAAFLRYAFESLLSLRYGYGMCPCDSELISGYPVEASERAVPEQLNSFARGIISLNQINTTTTIAIANTGSTAATAIATQPIDQAHENLILKFIRLISEASNLMVPHLDDLGDCKKYRSLYLLSMEIPNDILPKWIAVMLLMFIVSRILTYFVVKTVIKLRRS